MKTRLWFGVLLMSLLIVAPVAYAIIVEGNVTSVNLDGHLFKVFAQDPLTGEKKNLDVIVTPKTKMEGISSILELELGDDILIDAQPTKNGRTLKATSVKVPLSEISDNKPEPFAEDQTESWTEKPQAQVNPINDKEVVPLNKKANRIP